MRDIQDIVLGQMLIDKDAAGMAAAWLRPEFFAEPHQSVYRAVLNCQATGQGVDLLTVWHMLRRMKSKVEAHDLAVMTDRVGSGAWFRDHCMLLAQAYLADYAKRRGGQEAQKIATGEDPFEVLDRSGDDVVAEVVDMFRHEALADIARKAADEPASTQTGCVVDELIGGLGKGTLNMFAARPGHGKTSVALAVMAELCRRGVKCMFVTMEMMPEQLWRKLHEPDTDWPLEIVSERKLDRICAKVAQARPEVVFIDYVNLIDYTAAKGTNSADRMNAITSRIKSIAMDHGIAVWLNSQLNRELERREEKKPRMSDLRDGGEQDADNIIFLYRPYQYDQSYDPNELDLTCAKARYGSVGQDTARFDFSKCTWDHIFIPRSYARKIEDPGIGVVPF